MMKKNTIIIGIAGASASGKTLLANTIVNELGSNQVVVISEDCYYHDLSHLNLEARIKVNFDHPKALDHNLLSQHLDDLQKEISIQVPQYDHTQHIRCDRVRQIDPPYTIIVFEGILLFTEAQLRDKMDIRIFMDTPLDICFIRRLKRDTITRQRTIDSVFSQYLTTVRPMYFQFIEPSKRYADIIVPRGGKNRIAIDMIKTKMRELLNDNVNNSTDS